LSDTNIPGIDVVQTKLDAARQYIAKGWPVFVLGEGKTPLPNCHECRPEVAGPHHDRESCPCLSCHGFYAATLDELRVKRMLTRNPGGMLALRTGGVGRLLVIDAEASVGTGAAAGLTGLDVLDAWESWVDDWTLPKTLRQRTGGGGLHLVYRIPADIRVSGHPRILPQVDIKAEFGYIAVWSGEGQGDGRVWLGDLNAVVEAPPQLISWLADSKGKSFFGKGGGGSWGQLLDNGSYKKALQDGVSAGEREGFFARLSFESFTRGLTKSQVEALLYEHWTRCEQPLGNEFPWQWVEYKIQRDAVNVKSHVQEIPAWNPYLSIGSGSVVSVDEPITQDESGPNVQGQPEFMLHFTDSGLGERYAARMRKVARYDPVSKAWFVWTGAHWVQDTFNRALLWTKEIIKDIYLESTQVVDDDTGLAANLRSFAQRSESLTSRRAMLAAASAEPGMVVQPDDFDADPWLLVVGNGTIDLKTQTLRESLPEDLNTKCAGVSYDPNAKCPRWLKHIEFLTMSDVNIAAYLQRVAGYTLTGLINEQKFFFFEGKGANGKNVFIEPLLDIMGSYGLRGSSALITGGDEQHPTIIMQLLGKRMVFVDEAKQGRALNVERIKELTGSKKLNARGISKDPVEFDARLKLFIAGNNHPKISDTSDGTWRRMQRILCENKIGEDELIKDYARILFEEEGPGILNWCLEGLRAWQELEGLGTPKSVLDAVSAYRSEEDYIGQFIEECLVVTGNPEDNIIADEMFTTYRIWAEMSGMKGADLYNKITFGKHMAVAGYEARQKKVEGVNKRRFSGLRLLQGIPSWPAKNT